MSQTIDPNKQYFYDGKIAVGALAYYGLPNQDPKVEANQIKIYSDRETTIEIDQPQQTDDQGILPPVFVKEQLYSFKVETAPEQNSEQITLQLELEPLNGVGLVTDNIDMNGFKHTNVAEATENNEYLTLGQSYRKFPQGVVSDPASLENALVANLPIAPDALLFGQPIRLYLDGVPANSTNAVTLKLGAFAAKQLYKGNNLPLAIGDTWGPGAFLDLIYDDVLDKFQLLNPKSAQELEGENGAFYLARANHTGTQDFNTTTTGQVPQSRMANNSVGAPQLIAGSVGESEVATGAIHQAELSTGTDSGTLSTTGSYDVENMAGGQYSFYPQSQVDNDPSGGQTEFARFNVNGENNGAGGFGTRIAFRNAGSGGVQFGSWNNRFINSSPPWSMGHGDIIFFIFLRVNEKGEVTGGTSSEAPPWAYHGPTDITGDVIRKVNGKKKKYKYIDAPDKEIILPPWQGGDPKKWDVDAYLNRERVLVEVDHSIKNADMKLVPHSFVTMREGESVVFIDPHCPIVEKLLELQISGEHIITLFRLGYLTFSQPSNCNAPDGCVARKAKWKK